MTRVCSEVKRGSDQTNETNLSPTAQTVNGNTALKSFVYATDFSFILIRKQHKKYNLPKSKVGMIFLLYLVDNYRHFDKKSRVFVIC